MSVIEVPASPAQEVTNQDVFTRAADLIEEWGHCKGVLRNPDGHFCLFGAVLQAHQDLTGEPGSLRLLLMARGDEYTDALGVSQIWNDKPETTREDVIRLLREKAAA